MSRTFVKRVWTNACRGPLLIEFENLQYLISLYVLCQSSSLRFSFFRFCFESLTSRGLISCYIYLIDINIYIQIVPLHKILPVRKCITIYTTAAATAAAAPLVHDSAARWLARSASVYA